MGGVMPDRAAKTKGNTEINFVIHVLVLITSILISAYDGQAVWAWEKHLTFLSLFAP